MQNIGPAKRSLAWVIDLSVEVSIAIGGFAILYFPALIVVAATGDYGLEGLSYAFVYAVLGAGVLLILWWASTIVMIAKRGWTPGCNAIDVRIVRAGGGRLGWGRSALRVLIGKGLWHVPLLAAWSSESFLTSTVGSCIALAYTLSHAWVFRGGAGVSATDLLVGSRVVKL